MRSSSRSISSRFICHSWLFFAVIFVFPALLSAIVVTDDPADHEFDYTSEFAGVGYLSSAGGTTGVLISPNCILTAAHAVSSMEGHTFTLNTDSGPESFNMVEKFINESIDLAIVQLDRSTGLPGYEINTSLYEVGNEAIIVGFGNSGIGETQASLYPRGVGRYGTNLIDRTYAGMLVFDFDENTDDVMISSGDSGGPTFMYIEGRLQLIGIHTGTSDYDGDGILAEYGDRGYDARLSAYSDWLNGTIPELHFLEGDANGDGVVSAADYACVQANFGKSGTPYILGDANGDGVVSAADYASIQANLGNNTVASAASPIVPEPGTLVLIISGAVMLIRSRR